MRRRIWFVVAILTCGCGKDSERLSKVCSLTTAKIETMTSGVRAKLKNGVEAARGETGLDSRVATRLRWDKEMDGADVRVLVADGVLQLEGTVVSAAQQRRAVELATTTMGVEKVESKLTVRAQK